MVEVRPGEGGDDAAVFAGELASIITSLCRRRNVGVSQCTTGRTIVLELSGGVAEAERLAGVHRIQRIPANDKRGRRHTSTATIVVLGGARHAEVAVRDEDLRIKTKRGTGAGGQHRNVTDSAVEILHRPTGLVVQIDSGRSQHQNKERAVEILAGRLTKREQGRLARERNAERRTQIATGRRSSKDWTWNSQRGEVVCHSTGERYEMGRLLSGRV